MVKSWGIHPAHDAALAGNDLRHAIRAMAESEGTDVVGLSLAANVMDQIADALGRHWQSIREQEQRAEQQQQGGDDA